MDRSDANAVRGPHVLRDQMSSSHPGSGHFLHQHRLCFCAGTHGHSWGPIMPPHVDLATSRKGVGGLESRQHSPPPAARSDETMHPLEEAD